MTSYSNTLMAMHVLGRWPRPSGWSVGVAMAGPPKKKKKTGSSSLDEKHASSSVWWWYVWLLRQGLESGNPAVWQFQANIYLTSFSIYSILSGCIEGFYCGHVTHTALPATWLSQPTAVLSKRRTAALDQNFVPFIHRMVRTLGFMNEVHGI